MIYLRTTILSVMLIAAALFGCTNNNSQQSIESWKKEILETEKAFEYLAASEGVSIAFKTFAAEDAVLKRSDQLIAGKPAIELWLAKSVEDPSSIQLSWSPDFVDVANSGDLGYTYGKYTVQSKDSLGNIQESHGIFHTVWKRQADGSWKYVWD